MHRLVVATFGLSATLLFAACGGSTSSVTATYTVSGQAASVVATSDSAAIVSLKSNLASFFQHPATGTTASVQLLDGDQHTGNQVCNFSASKNGHTYNVVAYGAAPSSTCSNQSQPAFLSQAP